MGQRTGKIFAQARAHVAGEGARLLQPAVEVFRTFRKPEGFELRRATGRVLAQQQEVAIVGYKHQAVAAPVAADLSALRREPGVVCGRLYLDHAALRRLPLTRPALLHLLGRVEAEVGMARALVGKLADAEHLGLERRADGIEQVRQRPVARPLPGRAAGGADSSEVGEICLDRRRQFGVRSAHRLCCRRGWCDMQAPPPCRNGNCRTRRRRW